MTDIKLVLEPTDTALVVHDMENGFLKPPHGNPSLAEHIIGPIQKLLAVARRLRMPIIYTKVVYGPAGLEASARTKLVGVPGLQKCKHGTRDTEVIEELKPQSEDIIIEKIRFSGFYETGLERRLRGLGIKNLLITGVSTNWGIEALARDAEYRDFIAIVLSDCTAGTTPELHAASLANIARFIGFVKTSEEATEMLANR